MVSSESIIPLLINPLVLIGFVIFLFYGLVRLLTKAKVIPQLPRSTAGQIISSFLRYSFIISMVVIFFGFSIEALKIYTNSAPGSTELNRALHTVTLSISYSMTVPFAAPETSGYLERLRHMADELVQDYKRLKLPFSANSAVLGTELTRNRQVSLAGGLPGDGGYLMPTAFHIHPQSPLLPREDTENVAWSLLNGTSLSLTFYRRHIPENEFENIFSIGHPQSDISLAMIPNASDLSFEYVVGSDYLIVRINRKPVPLQNYMENSGNLISINDISNVQLFIYPNYANLALREIDEKRFAELKREIRLDTLDVDLGGGTRFDIPITPLKKIVSGWGDSVFVYTFPTKVRP